MAESKYEYTYLQEISETGRQGQERKTRGNRDKQRVVRDELERGWRWVREGDQRCNGKGVEWNGVVGDPSVIQYLTASCVRY